MINKPVEIDKVKFPFLVLLLFLIFSVNIVYAADCGEAIACSCGDNLNSSRTLNASDNLTDCSENGLIINASNVNLDCAGYTISGDYSGSSEYGVFIQTEAAGNRTNVTIKNCIIYGFNGLFSAGISTYTAYGNPENYNNTKIINNTIYDNEYGIDAYKATGNYWLIENNTVTNSTSSGIIINKNDSIVRNNTVETSRYGIFAGYGHNITIIDNVVNNSRDIYGGGNGIELSFNGIVYVYNNTITNSENDGIYITAVKTENVTINGNSIYNNSRYGLNIERVENNRIWHNNIYNNTNQQVYANDAIELSYNNEGNYWGYGTCPLFTPGVDSNAANITDTYPYNTSNGWSTGSPINCPLLWANPSNITPINYTDTTYSQFNITWSDNIGVDKVFITIINSTGNVIVNNSSMTNSYGIYSYSIILPAGTFNWTTYANNTNNDWNSSAIWEFTISKGALNLSISFIPSNIVVNPTQTTAIGNESNEGDDDVIYELRRDSVLIDNTTPYQEIVTLPIGTYNYTFNATDGQNWTANSTGFSALLTIQQSGFLPGGGSGDIPIYLVNRKKGNINITITSVDAGDKQSVAILRTEDMTFRRVIVYAKNALNNIKIMVTKLEGLPASVTRDVSGETYHYINVTIDNFADPDLENATIEFAIPKLWLENNNIDKLNITLYRWQNQNWNALPTTQISETDTEVFYSAVTSGFSYFVIGTIEIITAAPTTCTENWICTEWSSCVDGKETKTCTDSHDCGTEANKPETSRDCILEQILVGAEDLGLGGILVASGIILAIVVMILLLVKGKKMDLSFLKRKKKFKYKYKHKPKK